MHDVVVDMNVLQMNAIASVQLDIGAFVDRLPCCCDTMSKRWIKLVERLTAGHEGDGLPICILLVIS